MDKESAGDLGFIDVESDEECKSSGISGIRGAFKDDIHLFETLVPAIFAILHKFDRLRRPIEVAIEVNRDVFILLK